METETTTITKEDLQKDLSLLEAKKAKMHKWYWFFIVTAVLFRGVYYYNGQSYPDGWGWLVIPDTVFTFVFISYLFVMLRMNLRLNDLIYKLNPEKSEEEQEKHLSNRDY